MKLMSIRSSTLTILTTIALLGIAAGGASAAEPITHDSGTSQSETVIYVSGSDTAAQTIQESAAIDGYLVGWIN